jgi:hypothetical protein
LAADAFDRFKQEILADAAFEDWQGVWEPLWWLRGGGEIPGQSDADRQAFAERALRELHGEGLIYFVRSPWPATDLGDVASNAALHLTLEAVDEMLRDDWWRGDGVLPADVEAIWFGATPGGEAACRDRSVDSGWPPECRSRVRLSHKGRGVVRSA